jgi:hypothetical protein
LARYYVRSRLICADLRCIKTTDLGPHLDQNHHMFQATVKNPLKEFMSLQGQLESNDESCKLEYVIDAEGNHGRVFAGPRRV